MLLNKAGQFFFLCFCSILNDIRKYFTKHNVSVKFDSVRRGGGGVHKQNF